MLEKVIALLQRHGRLSYRALKVQFELDDGRLDILKEEGEVLVWMGEASSVDRPPMAGIGPPAFRDIATVTSPASSANEAETAPNRTPAAPESSSTAVESSDAASTTASSHTSTEAERRHLTVMFCDLADSTKLSQQLDPEDLREVVQAYQTTAAEIIQQYEGHIAQYLGDGLLIYFGWPVAHEDDAQRSAHAGLGIVEAITRHLNRRLEHEQGVQLTLRLGIHTGPVVVGEMGGGDRHENLATGETVNIAARLEALAAPNTVVISSTTARLVAGGFALENLGVQMLKGVAEPMQILRVIGPRETQEGEMGIVGAPFLIGRDEEVGLLLRRWEQSKEGLGQAVLISGEAGIGKSSLLATVRQHVRREGHLHMVFRCSPHHTNSALYPVIEHVQRVLQFQPGDTPATKLDKLAHVLSRYSRPLDEVVPLYAVLLSVPVPEGRYGDASGHIWACATRIDHAD